MPPPSALWKSQMSLLWTQFDQHSADEFCHAVETLAAELAPDDPIGLFERGCAQDSTGRSDLAIPLYEAALTGGLEGLPRRRATIQLCSSLRNMDRVGEAISLLSAELLQPSDELDGAVRGFLALALASAGRDKEALSHSLTALSSYLPRYNASLKRYADDLVDAQAN